MSLLAISYPELEESDFNWIQLYRKENDDLYYKVVDPHFTLIFPTTNIDEDQFIEEIKNKSKNVHQIEFEIRCATINKDAFSDYYYEFLVPDKGYSDIVKLHDKLYSGILSKCLRLDIDFIPHIGIGDSLESNITKKI